MSALGSSAASDCWSYTSPSGREYAIVCLYDKTAFVEVSNPTSPVVVATKTGPSSTWRDAKVFEDFCYVVSEGGNGIQVFDLSNIDSGTVTKHPDVTTGGSFSTHNVAINEDSGYLYRTGGSGNGLLIYDLNVDPTNPPLVATWPDRYVHDAQQAVVAPGRQLYAGREKALRVGEAVGPGHRARGSQNA